MKHYRQWGEEITNNKLREFGLMEEEETNDKSIHG